MISSPSTRPRRRTIACAGVAAALVAFAVPSIPAASAAGTFSITPSQRDLVVRPPAKLAPTRVSNTTKNAYDVQAFPVLLRQGLTGAFEFDEAPGSLSAARTIMRVSPSRFRLAPGRSRTVGVRWEQTARGKRAAYVGLVFQGQPRLKGGRSVPVITRLLSTNFLRVPGRYHANGIFKALNAAQAAPKVLRFLPRVANTGDVVASPTAGRLTIANSTGRTAYSTTWRGDVILPGAKRDFPIDVRRILPAGRYSARATMRFGTNRRARKISSAFTLVGPNQLPTPAVEIAGFAAHGEVGGPARLSGSVRSTGTSPASVDLAVSLFRVTKSVAAATPIASRKLRFSELAPGTSRALAVDLSSGLTRGTYRVVGTYTDPTGAPQSLSSDFAASPHLGALTRLRRFLDRHKVTIGVVLALLLVGGVGLRLLRRQRRLEAELRAARAQRDAGAPPA